MMMAVEGTGGHWTVAGSDTTGVWRQGLLPGLAVGETQRGAGGAIACPVFITQTGGGEADYPNVSGRAAKLRQI